MVAAVVGATVVGGYLASENMADASDDAARVQAGAARDAASLSSDASVRAAQIQADASGRAAGMQQASAREAISARGEQFNLARSILQPWVTQGDTARNAQGDLVGLNGAAPQQAAIDALKAGPAFTSMQKTGQNAILSASSATGGLRGGNVNGALAQYDTTLLSQLIDQQYGRLTGIANTGYGAGTGIANAAVGVGNSNAADIIGAGNAGAAGVNNAATAQAFGINNAAAAGAAGINNAASAEAGGILGNARADNLLINSAVNAAGVYAGYRPPSTNPAAGYAGGLNPATGTSFGPTFANQ